MDDETSVTTTALTAATTITAATTGATGASDTRGRRSARTAGTALAAAAAGSPVLTGPVRSRKTGMPVAARTAPTTGTRQRSAAPGPAITAVTTREELIITAPTGPTITTGSARPAGAEFTGSPGYAADPAGTGRATGPESTHLTRIAAGSAITAGSEHEVDAATALPATSTAAGGTAVATRSAITVDTGMTHPEGHPGVPASTSHATGAAGPTSTAPPAAEDQYVVRPGRTVTTAAAAASSTTTPAGSAVTGNPAARTSGTAGTTVSAIGAIGARTARPAAVDAGDTLRASPASTPVSAIADRTAGATVTASATMGGRGAGFRGSPTHSADPAVACGTDD